MNQHPSLKLSIAQFLLANLLFMAMIVGLSLLLIGANNVPIEFAKKEQAGNHYQRTLERILHVTTLHKLAHQRIALGNPAHLAAMLQYEKDFDQLWPELEKTQAQWGTTLEFTPQGLAKRKREHLELAKIKQRWDAVRALPETATHEEVLTAHNAFIADIRAMIAHAGDTSNLILDPDLDSYYLMDITLLALPQLQDRLQSVLSTMEFLLVQKSFGPDNVVDLAVNTQQLQSSDLDRIMADLAVVLVEDQNFFGTVPSLTQNWAPQLEQNLQATRQLIELHKKLMANPATTEVTAENYMNTADQALEGVYRAWDISVRELDTLLQKRIDHFVADQRRSIAYSLVAYVVCILFITFGLRTHIKQQRMISSVSHVCTQLGSEAHDLKSVAQTVLQTSYQLQERARSEAASIQQSVSAIEQMSASMKTTSDNSDHSYRLAETGHGAATQGRLALEKMVGAITEINQSNNAILGQMQKSNDQFKEMIAIIHEINNKTHVIHDIVFQTKLLAFNASVEAARAGEHGKGFAVVAQEVSNLAQMSGNAAKEIGEMLTKSIAQVDTIVKETQGQVDQLVKEGHAKIELGVQTAQECNGVFGQIIEHVQQFKSISQEIARAAKENAQGITEVTTTMNTLDQLAHENNITFQETAKVAETLNAHSQELGQVVTELLTVVQKKAA